jgi:hypothetical protein
LKEMKSIMDGLSDYVMAQFPSDRAIMRAVNAAVYAERVLNQQLRVARDAEDIVRGDVGTVVYPSGSWERRVADAVSAVAAATVAAGSSGQ